MFQESYNTIESVYAHFRTNKQVCLLQEEIDKVGLEFLITKQGLETLGKMVEESNRPKIVAMYHPKYNITATLDDYKDGKAIIMVIGMERR